MPLVHEDDQADTKTPSHHSLSFKSNQLLCIHRSPGEPGAHGPDPPRLRTAARAPQAPLQTPPKTGHEVLPPSSPPVGGTSTLACFPSLLDGPGPTSRAFWQPGGPAIFARGKPSRNNRGPAALRPWVYPGVPLSKQKHITKCNSADATPVGVGRSHRLPLLLLGPSSGGVDPFSWTDDP